MSKFIREYKKVRKYPLWVDLVLLIAMLTLLVTCAVISLNMGG